MKSEILTEIWKEVPGFEGLYKVSNMGRVWSVRHKKILKQGTKETGYKYVNLRVKYKQKNFRVNRLVAFAFIPNPKNLPMVNHKNRDKSDNSVENLEWCDGHYNQRHWHGTLDIEDCSNIIYSRVWTHNLKHPELYKESARTAVKKYRECGYIPEYIYNEDLN